MAGLLRDVTILKIVLLAFLIKLFTDSCTEKHSIMLIIYTWRATANNFWPTERFVAYEVGLLIVFAVYRYRCKYNSHLSTKRNVSAQLSR